MGSLLLKEDLISKFKIIDKNTPKGQKIHEFLLNRAKLLVRDRVDFEKTPVSFLMSDMEEPNAFYTDLRNQKIRNRDENQKVYIEPYGTRIICVTKGLIDFVDSLDELDFVLGHELTHMILRDKEVASNNSKGEELVADLHSVDLVYDAGSDPKQSLVFSKKLKEHGAKLLKKLKEEERNRQGNRRYKEEEKGISWSEVLDVHVSDSNRVAAIEAALTRLSHLIDDRESSSFDKTTFAVEYSDPVDVYLKNKDYENKNYLGKMRILIDAVKCLSKKQPAEEYFQARLDALPEIGEEDKDEDWDKRWRIERKKREIQEKIDNGYEGYFYGSVLEKKYQQKIARLAEKIISDVYEVKEKEERRREKVKEKNDYDHLKPSLNVKDLNVYLLNEAYKEIKDNGFPEQGESNYFNASSLMYTYFNTLFSRHVSQEERYRHYRNEVEGIISRPSKKPLLEMDINNAREKIFKAKEIEEFKLAIKEFRLLARIDKDIKDTSYGDYSNKMNNLSFVNDYDRCSSSYVDKVYDGLEVEKSVPWDNLLEIVKKNEEAKDYIVEFLKEEDIVDLRITHNKPYIKIGNYNRYRLDEEGKVSDDRIPETELDFIMHPEKVLAAYDCIKKYFDSETKLFNKTCYDILNLKEWDFVEFNLKRKDDDWGPRTAIRADAKLANFITMYNALPEEETERNKYNHSNGEVLSFIPSQYLRRNPIPGLSKEEREEGTDLDRVFFCFDNKIFKDYFGGDFKEKVLREKEEQEQKLFNIAFQTFKNAEDMCKEALLKKKSLDEEIQKLYKETEDLEEGDEKNKKSKKLRALRKESDIVRYKESLSQNVILHFLSSLLREDYESYYSLKRIKPEHKEILANYIVRDEKDILVRLLDGRYTTVCDYLNIASDQVDKFVSGSYDFTDEMKIVAKNIGYKPIKTKEDLVSSKKERERRDYGYGRYLRFIDIMKCLEEGPSTSLVEVLSALSSISSESPSQYSDDRKVRAKLYERYSKIIKETNVIPLVTRALKFNKNFGSLSFEENVATADALISTEKEMRGLLEKRICNDYDDDEVSIDPEYKKFLKLLGRKSRNLLRRSFKQILDNDNALEKMMNLHSFFNPQEQYSSEHRRCKVLNKIEAKDKLKEKLSGMAMNDNFWPEDILDNVKSYVFAKNTFLDDIEFENELLNNIFDKLDKIPSSKKKNECLYILLDRNLRASFPETRQRLSDMYVADTVNKIGKDDGSEKYKNRFSLYLKALDHNEEKKWDKDQKLSKRSFLYNGMSSADQYMMLKQLADEVVSQEETSMMMKDLCQFKVKELSNSYLYGIGVDYLTATLDRNSTTANKFIQFLNSKGEAKDCSYISTHLNKSIEEYYDYEIKTKEVQPTNCKVLYENFWSAPLEARAVITARLLKSAANTKDNKKNKQQSWESVFDLVMGNMISPDDVSTESRYARDIMHSYIKARSSYERELILSAMMVANRNVGKDAGNVGKALKLFLENMGPAEIKLGQAIASHPSTPEKIRLELQGLKNEAAKPARWVLYDWINGENIPEELWKDKYLGKILGSASYYTTAALGDVEVLRLLRPEAREKAVKGFSVLKDVVEDLKAKDTISDLDYTKLTASVSEMIKQADRMSEVETDHELGQKQYEYSQEIYNGVKINGGSEIFSLNVMDWRSKGKNWIIMDRAKGCIFNVLPESTLEQITYKKEFAKSYIIFEVVNILKGKKFDHDRHGAQLCVDQETNEAGIFDTGAMALEDPTAQEQKLLGNVFYGLVSSYNKGGSLEALGGLLSDKIENLHKKNIDTRYLIEVQKGILALGDFTRILDKEDMFEVLSRIKSSVKLSKHIIAGVTEKMSLKDKFELGVALVREKPQETSITQDIVEVNTDVLNIDIAPNIAGKAEWFNKSIVDLSKEKSKDFIIKRSNPKQYACV